jgi:hypothetical protein
MFLEVSVVVILLIIGFLALARFRVQFDANLCAVKHDKEACERCIPNCHSFDASQTTYIPYTPVPLPLIRTPLPSGVTMTSAQITAHLPSDLTGQHRAQVVRIMRALPPNRRVNVRWTTDLLGQFVVYEDIHQGDCFPDLVETLSDKDVFTHNTSEWYCKDSGEAHPMPGTIQTYSP